MKEFWCKEKYDFCKGDETNPAIQEFVKILESEIIESGFFDDGNVLESNVFLDIVDNESDETHEEKNNNSDQQDSTECSNG